MLSADPASVSARAKKRGLPQLGTLGAGNHYCEIQVIDKIFDAPAAAKMGLDFVGQVCVMVHSGSRGLGHQVATDALVNMEKGACPSSPRHMCHDISLRSGLHARSHTRGCD